jgi:hypothetical protein
VLGGDFHVPPMYRDWCVTVFLAVHRPNAAPSERRIVRCHYDITSVLKFVKTNGLKLRPPPAVAVRLGPELARASGFEPKCFFDERGPLVG